MHCSEPSRRLARHRLALPIALLLTTAISSAAPGAEVTINDGESYSNRTNVTDIFGTGNVGVIENLAGVRIGDALDRAVEIIGDVGTFINGGTIVGDGDGVNIGGDVTAFVNTAGGSIVSNQFVGVYFSGNVNDFSNAGAIMGVLRGVDVVGVVTSFTNQAGGTIEGGNRSAAALERGVGAFSNAGRMTGLVYGLYVTGDVGSFVNTAEGTIIGGSESGVEIYGVIGSFNNAGRISGGGWGVYLGGLGLDSFYNAASGVIDGELNAVRTDAVRSFVNDGVLRNADGSPTVLIDRDAGSFSNRGTISGGGWGVSLESVDAFFNSGTISALGPGPRIGVVVGPSTAGAANSFLNFGTIEANETAVWFNGGVANMINAGVLRGGDYALRSQGVNDDTLTLLTGSRIFGALSFGGGHDTLDFSRFAGNTVLDVSGLETLAPGNRNYVDTRHVDPLAGGVAGKIGIFDISGLDNKAISRTLGDVAGAVRGLVTDQLAGAAAGQPASVAPLGYAAAKPTTGAAAALTTFETTPATDAHVWASALGGGSVEKDALDLSSRYGGLVAGSHVRVGDTLILGGLAGYFGSSSSSLGGEEKLDSQTGLVGLYGKTAVGVVDLDFTLLVGVSGHTSKREVVANHTTETATGEFTSVFIAPNVGLSIPVLSVDATTVSFRGEATYVAGLSSAYTETGSSMNLAVGGQTIGFLDVRVGLEARNEFGSKTEFVAKAGVLGQANVGSSSVPVIALGQAVDAGSPGSGGLGVYGGVGFDAALNDNAGFALRLDGSVRANGPAGFHASAGFTGTF